MSLCGHIDEMLRLHFTKICIGTKLLHDQIGNVIIASQETLEQLLNLTCM